MDVLIGNILPVSTIDYPGKSAAVVFMGGCNFRCGFCYNTKILDPILCNKITTEQVFKQVVAGEEIIDAVVLSGGEPTAQPEALMELCQMFKKEGLSVKLDTNGSNAGIVAELVARKLVDYIALDVKAPLERQREYERIIGLDAREVIHSINQILQLHKAFKFTLECRTTYVPGLLHHHDIEQIAKEVSRYADLYVLQQFTPERGCLDPKLTQVKAPTRDELREIAKHAKKYVKDTRIRTKEMGEEKL